MDPRAILSPRRLDVVVKYLFFLALIENRDVAIYEKLYRKHIELRTGGAEKRDASNGRLSEKRSVDDYVAACHALLHSMRTNGFQDKHAIPLGVDGSLLNGAHRLACALALGLRIAVERMPMSGPGWGFDWSVQREFSAAELSLVLGGWCTLLPEKTTCFILWAAVEPQWRALQSALGQIFDFVGAVDFEFSERVHYASVIQDIYSFETTRAVLPSIDRKIAELELFAPKFRMVVLRNRSDTLTTSIVTKQTKQHLRKALHGRIAEEKFVPCHSSDSTPELQYLSRVLLDPRNTRWFPYRSRSMPRLEMLRWVESLKIEMSKRGIPIEDCCVVGSSTLEVFGIRNSTDLDFTLKSKWRYEKFNSGITKVNEMLDVVTAGYHRVHAPRVAVSDDELVADSRHHFLFRGVKFANLNIVADRKDFSRRPKDVADGQLITPVLEDWRGRLGS